jgi:hypothetical protein
MGGYDMATLPAHIKSYNANIKLLKYMNFNQIEVSGSSLDHTTTGFAISSTRAWWRWTR